MTACGIKESWRVFVWAILFGWLTVAVQAEDKKVITLPLSENLIISAETVSPAMDEKTGDLIGLSASGQVSVKVRPKGAEKWIYVTCGELVYDVDNDEIILKGRPVVKSGIQVLKATSDKTYVHVSRKTGKWVIKGPHKIQIKFK
ncbi:MAG: hypothetical protein GXP30_08280 [Verrucomicrobia bacterium]|nr:hypothetical protein [Verrucomicrobiota bacterium]